MWSKSWRKKKMNRHFKCIISLLKRLVCTSWQTIHAKWISSKPTPSTQFQNALVMTSGSQNSVSVSKEWSKIHKSLMIQSSIVKVMILFFYVVTLQTHIKNHFIQTLCILYHQSEDLFIMLRSKIWKYLIWLSNS